MLRFILSCSWHKQSLSRYILFNIERLSSHLPSSYIGLQTQSRQPKRRRGSLSSPQIPLWLPPISHKPRWWLFFGFPPLSPMEGSADDQRLDFGKMGYGCNHYRRRCLIRAPCCNEVFHCRHCHNDAANLLKNPSDRHELVRHEVMQVICAVCDTEQPAARVCTNCGVRMGEYFCEICKFYDDDLTKEVFHCEECGICRVGGRENFFHCKRCGSCYGVGLRDNHMCVENSMRHHCPICYEYLFDSLKETTVLKCGHTMHLDCLNEMTKHDQYCCPICSKSVFDMSKAWKRIDYEVQSTIMPEDYRNKKVWILCNDCNDTTEVFFHIIGQKCTHCNSYNTRTISPPVLPS